MSGNGQLDSVHRVILPLLAATIAALTHPPNPPAGSAVEVEASPAEVAALRALGADVRFFTSRARPLRRLADLREPGAEVGSADLELARGVMSLLRAGGVPFAGGAHDVMTLTSDHHLPSLFTRHKALRFFLLRARPDGAERAIVERGGGQPLVFRPAASEPPAAKPPSTAPGAPGPNEAVQARAGDPRTVEVKTSFGPLKSVRRGATARQRTWGRIEAKLEEKPAPAGRIFVTLHIERDFSAGLGKVAYLYGSGIILDPDFTQLVILEGPRRHPPTAIHADGPTLELAYLLPTRARNLRLQDGDTTWPLPEPLATAP